MAQPMHHLTHRQTVETKSPIVQAAYEIAKRAHDGQGRGKAGLPYLVHPIMLHDLLVHFGETDELTLACALLHDAKEDNEEYIADPELMRKELEGKFRAAGITDAGPIAHYIDEMCNDLTNASEMFEGKRVWQVEHVGKISLRATKIKIFDQMASVLDNILSPDDKADGKGNRWSQSWSYKALDVVKASAEQRPQLNFYRDMFKVLFKYNMKILNAPDDAAAAELRKNFDWVRAEKDAHALEKEQTPDVPTVDKLNHRRGNEIDKGILQVQFAKDGSITHYTVIADPLAEKKDPKSAVAIDAMGAIEASKTERRVTVGGLEVENGRMVRINKIKPPMQAKEFTELTMKHGALEQSFAVEIMNRARELYQGQSPG